MNVSLARGWTEAALEAAFRSDAYRAATLASKDGFNNTYERKSDATLRSAWENDTRDPLTPPEAAEAAEYSVLVQTSDLRRTLGQRDVAQSLILSLAEHRAMRASIWGAL
jgi:hypothetical protein